MVRIGQFFRSKITSRNKKKKTTKTKTNKKVHTHTHTHTYTHTHTHTHTKKKKKKNTQANAYKQLESSVGRVSAPRSGGTGFDPGLRHTKVVNNSTSCSPLGTRIFGVGLGLVAPVSV